MVANHSHRAGKLKQQNKKNKRSSASKRSVNRKAGAGKVQSGGVAGGGGGGGTGRGGRSAIVASADAKANRNNAARQRRDNARKSKYDSHRRLGGGALASASSSSSGGAAVAATAICDGRDGIPQQLAFGQTPRLVGIISLSHVEGTLEEIVRNALVDGGTSIVRSMSPSSSSSSSSSIAKGDVITTVAYGKSYRGTSLSIMTNHASFRHQYSDVLNYDDVDASVQGAMDLCRVCDMVLFVIDGGIGAGGGGGSSGGSIRGGTTSVAHDDNDVISCTSGNNYDDLLSVRGERILTAIKAQGLPTPVTVIVHPMSMSSSSPRTHVGRSVGETTTIGNAGGDGTMMDDDDVDDNDDDDDNDEEEVEMNDVALPDAVASSSSSSSVRTSRSILRTRIRRRAELRRYVTRLSVSEFGERGGKVMEIDAGGGTVDGDDGSGDGTMDHDGGSVSTATTTTAAAANMTDAKSRAGDASISALTRLVCTVSASGPNWASDAPRPYLVTDGSIASSSSHPIRGVRYDPNSSELSLTGYIRGNAPLNVNRPMHVPHLGTYSVKDVRLAGVTVDGRGGAGSLLPPIVAAGRKSRAHAADDASATNGGGMGALLASSNVEERESLEMFASPDALEGEQNLIGFDEDIDIDDVGPECDAENVAGKSFRPGTSRPAGWSDYQSAWLDALDGNDEEGEDHGELAFALNNKKSDNDTHMGDDDDDGGVNAEERRALLAQRRKAAKGDLRFPDEVEYEEETSARDRYARYRALKSFRKSHWDPKENLPDTYGAIYHFASFKATQRDVLEDVRELEDVIMRKGWGAGVDAGKDDAVMEGDDSEEEEEEAEATLARACVPPGAYVTITLEGVSKKAFAGLSQHSLLAAVSLLPHETKVSVLHMGLSTTPSKFERADEGDASVPVKSKDVLTFRCGWRTWQSRPVFSQHNLNSDKHKFERYMPAGGNGAAYFAGSVFGPVSYAPCPVMMFREVPGANGGGGRRELLAYGSMLGADADRIVLKRIILTGYPTRVHKRHATVKYMFYNPEDVKWFMPAGITTKHGLQGNIIQSVGDHGVMKCLFNAPIKQHDTVCLPLYKRVFPKFAPVAATGDELEDEPATHFRVL